MADVASSGATPSQRRSQRRSSFGGTPGRASQVQDSEASIQSLRDKVDAAQRAVQAAKESASAAHSSFREAQSAHEASLLAVAAAAKQRSDAEVAAAAAVRRAARQKGSPLAGALLEHSAVLAAPAPWISGQKQAGRISVGAVTRLFSKPRTSRAAAALVAQDVAEREAQAAGDQRLLAAVHGARDTEFDARVKAAALKKQLADAKAGVVSAEAARATAVAHLNSTQRALTAAQGRHARVSTPVVVSVEEALVQQRSAARASSAARPSSAPRASKQAGGTSAWVRAKMAAAQEWAARMAASTAKAAAGDARVAAQRQARVSKLQEQKAQEAQRLAAATVKRTESLRAAEEALKQDAISRGALEPPAPTAMPSFAPMESPLTQLAPEYSQRRVSGERSSFVVSSTPRSYLRSPRTPLLDEADTAAAVRAARASGADTGDAPAVCVGLTPSRPPPSAALVSPRQGNALGVTGVNMR